MTATEAVIVEGVAREVRDDEPMERALAVVPNPQAHLMSGLGAVAVLSDEQFERNLELLAKAKDRAQRMQKALLTPGVDYGTVPGIPRPFLHKPGAETFEKAYGLATSYDVERKVGDGIKTPELEYIVHAKVHLGDTDGPIVGEGLGSCNTHESKYRYRTAKRSCPDCAREGLVKGKAESRLKGGYWCPPDKGGCGHTFAVGSPKYEAIEEQVVGQVENENPWDLANTILKMARKRAGVDGILTATGTSGIFTQDDDSPSVQREAGGGGAAAQETTEQGRSTWKPTGTTKLADLPKVPKAGEIEEPTALGTVTVAGVIVITDKQRTDGGLRGRPDGGSVLGFQLDFAGGGKAATVVVEDELARAFAEFTDGRPTRVHETPVSVTGVLWADPWSDRETGEAKPPARRIVATAIQTETWKASVDAPEPAAAPKKAKAPAKQTTVAEAAHEASKATEPAEPGLTPDAFNKVLETARIAGTYALSIAKERYGVETLFALTDAQRLELAVSEGWLAQDEEEN